MIDDNLRAFFNDWEHVLAVMAKTPPEDVLETLFRKQLYGSQAVKDQIAYYDRLEVGHKDKTYDFLVSMVRKHLDTKRRHRAREELRGQVSAIAIASAEKILNREIDGKAHDDILGKLAQEL